MYCGKCGATVPDNVSFCPGCGEPCAKSEETKVYKVTKQPKLSGKTKKILAVVVAVVVVLVGVFSIKPTVRESCAWCGNQPSVRYKLSDGSYTYVCKDCSKECMFCGKKAKKHYENLFGMMVFVCNDCYKEMKSN